MLDTGTEPAVPRRPRAGQHAITGPTAIIVRDQGPGVAAWCWVVGRSQTAQAAARLGNRVTVVGWPTGCWDRSGGLRGSSRQTFRGTGRRRARRRQGEGSVQHDEAGRLGLDGRRSPRTSCSSLPAAPRTCKRRARDSGGWTPAATPCVTDERMRAGERLWSVGTSPGTAIHAPRALTRSRCATCSARTGPGPTTGRSSRGRSPTRIGYGHDQARADPPVCQSRSGVCGHPALQPRLGSPGGGRLIKGPGRRRRARGCWSATVVAPYGGGGRAAHARRAPARAARDAAGDTTTYRPSTGRSRPRSTTCDRQVLRPGRTDTVGPVTFLLRLRVLIAVTLGATSPTGRHEPEGFGEGPTKRRHLSRASMSQEAWRSGGSRHGRLDDDTSSRLYQPGTWQLRRPSRQPRRRWFRQPAGPLLGRAG